MKKKNVYSGVSSQVIIVDEIIVDMVFLMILFVFVFSFSTWVLGSFAGEVHHAKQSAPQVEVEKNRIPTPTPTPECVIMYESSELILRGDTCGAYIV